MISRFGSALKQGTLVPLGTSCRAFSAEAGEMAQRMRLKHKVPQKRASSLLNMLKTEEFDKLKKGRAWPDIKAGDSIQVDHLPNMSSKEPDVMKGLVIAKTNRSSDTAITMLNVEGGTPIMRRLVLYSPLIIDVKVIQKSALHKGRKRTRRSKLYYLTERRPDVYTVN